jgi:hypothetical protein
LDAVFNPHPHSVILGKIEIVQENVGLILQKTVDRRNRGTDTH